ncbi:channel-forming protein ArfA/OmpATb [Actinokineospora sp.]|uniref:channel-forming protein ArfA/OmpATb n=1 Tax=Actinokineospora sp. TaxID=1872133 RepID=UPI0040379347
MPGSAADLLSPGETLVRHTTTTTYPKRGGWLPWLVGLVLITALLAVLATLAPFGERAAVQDDLGAKSRAALVAAGITGADVRMDGVVAEVTGVQPGQVDAARAAVESVDGVWSANVVGTAAAPAQPGTATPAPAVAGVPLGFALKDGTVTLTGSVPDEAARAALVSSATEAAGGRPVVDQLTVTPGVTLPARPAELGKAVGALGASAGERSVRWDGDTVTLSGSVAGEADKAAAARQAAALAPGATVDNQLTVAAPAVDKQAVQRQLDALVAAQPITFQPNTALLTPAGAQTVQAIAPLLSGVAVQVSGHVAGTPGRTLDAQVLSEQRAATVQARLVELGVAADRITAKGFGDTAPLAPNDTPAGQAANRRVEITVV